MKKRLMIFAFFMVLVLTVSAYAQECPEDYPANDDGLCQNEAGDYKFADGATIPAGIEGKVTCDGRCSLASGGVLYGEATISAAGDVDMGTGGSMDLPSGASVSGPAKVKKDGSFSLTGGTYSDPTNNVNIMGTADFNGQSWSFGAEGAQVSIGAKDYFVSNAEGVVPKPDGTGFTGTASAAGAVVCIDAGNCMTFAAGQAIDIGFDESSGQFVLYSGNADLQPGFTGEIRTDGGTINLGNNHVLLSNALATVNPDGSATVHYGQVSADLTGDGSANDVMDVVGGTMTINPDGTRSLAGSIEVDFGGDNGEFGMPDARFSTPDFDMPVTITTDGASCTGNCMDISGQTLSVKGDGDLLLEVEVNVDSPYFNTLNANVKKGDLFVFSEGTFTQYDEGIGFTDQTRLEIPDMDQKKGLVLKTITNGEITINGQAPYYIKSDGTIMDCATCAPECALCTAAASAGKPVPEATGFFSFIGKAWDWLTGRAETVAPCDLKNLGSIAKADNELFGGYGDTHITLNGKDIEIDWIGADILYIYVEGEGVVEMVQLQDNKGNKYLLQSDGKEVGRIYTVGADGAPVFEGYINTKQMWSDLYAHGESRGGAKDRVLDLINIGSKTPASYTGYDLCFKDCGSSDYDITQENGGYAFAIASVWNQREGTSEQVAIEGKVTCDDKSCYIESGGKKYDIKGYDPSFETVQFVDPSWETSPARYSSPGALSCSDSCQEKECASLCTVRLAMDPSCVTNCVNVGTFMDSCEKGCERR